MSLSIVIGVQVLAVGVLLFLLTPALRRRAPGSEALLALGRTAGIVIGMVLIVLPFVGTPTPLTNTKNPVPGTVTSVSTGADLYQANCAACHGVDAQGGGPLAGTTAVQPPSLTAHLSAHTDGDLFYFISNGLPGGMPAWASQLTEGQRWDLVNYLRSINGASPAPASAGAASAPASVAFPLALPFGWLAMTGGFVAAGLRRRRRR